MILIFQGMFLAVIAHFILVEAAHISAVISLSIFVYYDPLIITDEMCHQSLMFKTYLSIDIFLIFLPLG